MTDYVKEMMKTAGIHARRIFACKTSGDNPHCNCFEDVLPPFTPEKQLEIIKLIFKKCFVDIQNNKINFSYNDVPISYKMDTDDFAQNLAALVNNLWKCLADEDKEKVKEILER